MAEKRTVCFQSKKSENMWVLTVILIFYNNNYYIYLKRYFKIFVTNDFCSIFWRSAALNSFSLTHSLYDFVKCFGEIITGVLLNANI